MWEGASSQLDWLYRIARALHYQGLDSQAILRTALSMTCSAVEVKQACIVTFDEDGDLRDALLLGGDAEEESDGWDQLISQGLVGVVQYGQRTVNVRNIGSDPRWPQLPNSWEGSALGVPLLHHSNLHGALVLVHPQIDYFSDNMSEFLEEAGGMIAAAYASAHGVEQLKAEADRAQQYYEKLQQATAKAAEVDQLRGDLAAMTYHDLRGLLQNIYASLTGMEPSVGSNRTAVSLLRLATQSTRQMTRMVKGLLDIDRLEQGSAVINTRRTALHPLLDEAMELVRPIASEAEQELGYEVVEPLPDVQIDPDMITRVLVNLIENAVKHTPPNGRVTLRVRAKQDQVYFTVSDTGPGIPANHQRDIFDKYYRIRHADAPNGVGLGLAFCRLAVEAHGGRIWVENLPVRGAVFTFTLPIEPLATTAAQA